MVGFNEYGDMILMQRRSKPFFLDDRLVLGMLLMAILILSGCAGMGERLSTSFPLSGHPADTLECNNFTVATGDDVIGRLATIRLEKGDTLPDVARHFSLGINDLNAANPGVDIWVPKAGERILLPLNFILPDARRNGIVINLATMRLFHYNKNGDQLAVATYPVGVGTEKRPTPMGEMSITRKKHRPTWYVPASIAADHRKKGDPLPASVPPGPLNPLGEYALYLSEPSYLIHGTNKPASIGLRATNGCIRLYPEDIERLFEKVRVKTPVHILNQPYLAGQHDGIVYLEAHMPFEESGTANWETAFAKLKRFEKRTGRPIDWKKVKSVVIEARGIPVPVTADHDGRAVAAEDPVRLRHPDRLYGQPEVPPFDTDAWYVLAASFPDQTDARRLAAIINHQGPPIPARVLSEGDRHRVLAGPFDNERAAKAAVKRLKIDLELDAVLFET